MSALRDALGNLSEDVFFDLLESEDAYLLVLDVPGVTADSLTLTVEDGRISIEAHREKDPNEDYRYLEENRSLFLDVELPLPADAVETESEATVERGVLELTLPKLSSGGETTIDVVDEDAG
ncbi:Hsp20/alpha crystallin family protein [Natronorubrum halophilum]|uniref:Hsp20/alpha crystallin family protein n=1 Tax=Natronorubrum halophilum TaxID=1702106 RepID=UPI000EF6CF4B|nr:Hsp20/alpha crystallin family protein [Natronorubrum halophilum]